jgi:hypothetical protein
MPGLVNAYRPSVLFFAALCAAFLMSSAAFAGIPFLEGEISETSDGTPGSVDSADASGDYIAASKHLRSALTWAA